MLHCEVLMWLFGHCACPAWQSHAMAAVGSILKSGCACFCAALAWHGSPMQWQPIDVIVQVTCWPSTAGQSFAVSQGVDVIVWALYLPSMAVQCNGSPVLTLHGVNAVVWVSHVPSMAVSHIVWYACC